MTTPRKRVVVIGGGVGAMTAAYYLAPHHDIKLYQIGWRLGGKGASGRNQNPELGHRIEEHGLHIWFGFYKNAFRLMRSVYGDLKRPSTHPLKTVEDAFLRHDVVTIMESFGKPPQWTPWIIKFEPNGLTPGESTTSPSRLDLFTLLMRWLRSEVREYASKVFLGTEDVVEITFAKTMESEVDRLYGIFADSANVDAITRSRILAVAKIIQATLQFFTRARVDLLEKDANLRHLVYIADLGVAVVSGFIRSDLFTEPWESIDDRDFHLWLSDNGLTPFSRWSSPVRAIYDLAFGYEDGEADEAHANMAAGSTLRGVMWMLFAYAGSIMYEMAAGMGDAVFAPMYLLLKQKKVEFHFFNRILELVPSRDGTRIDRIVIGIQAKPIGGAAAYDPLYDVNGVECWPSEPLYDRLENGDALRGIDLESYQSPILETFELEARTDFDEIIFGASIGSVPYLCRQLIDQKPEWKAMVDHVRTVQTQAFQLWLNRDIKELGWLPAINGTDGGQPAVLGTFVEPMDTWADLTHVLPREKWDPSQNVRNIAYFCGPLPSRPTAPPGNAIGHVVGFSRQFIRDELAALWTKAKTDSGDFPLDWLVARKKSTGEDRFRDQYFRANVEGSELYVLSVAGSTQHRLEATGTGYDNLRVAGDWNRNTLSLGCVESAVMGGIEAVQGLVNVDVIDEAPPAPATPTVTHRVV